jgi:hypothetical protein
VSKSEKVKALRHEHLIETSGSLARRLEQASRDAQHLVARYSASGLALHETPGLGRTLKLALRSKALIGACELELAGH